VPSPRAHRGRLRVHAGAGREIHAASFIANRVIVLEESLLSKPAELDRVVLHELFHFAWPRWGNPKRRAWEALLAGEIGRHARGEIGWSAESRKRALSPADREGRSRKWREYVCESFCDTAAWLAGGAPDHPECTLAAQFRAQRRRWLEGLLAKGRLRI